MDLVPKNLIAFYDGIGKDNVKKEEEFEEQKRIRDAYLKQTLETAKRLIEEEKFEEAVNKLDEIKGDQDLAAVIDVGRLEFGFNRFVSILERIGQRLAQLVPVALHAYRAIMWRFQPVIDIGVRDFLEEQRLPDQIEHVLRAETWFGQSRKAGEFIHHLPEITHLPNDRAGQFIEQLAILCDLFAVSALQSLRRVLKKSSTSP